MLKKNIFPKEREKKEASTVQTLKSRIRKLTKENKLLKSENKQLRRAWEKTEEKMKDIVEDFSLEDILDEVD